MKSRTPLAGGGRTVWRAGALTLGCAFLTWAASLAQTGTPPGKVVDKDHAAKMTRGLDLFKKEVRPILVQRCLKCHGDRTTESEFDLSNREHLLKGGAAGPAILPGQAKNSLLWKLITHAREPRMPHKAAKLSTQEITVIAAWIDLGAPYDRPLLERKDDGAAWTRKTIPPDARELWSFQPLRRVEPPRVRNESWVRTPIDRFILARQEAAGIAPNPAVSPRQLIRRAYFDLIGLPPTPEEVETFLKDSRADAYEKLLDRLLESPHHGERWARHWLDLARFAESHGFEHDYDRPTAYPYRDFVIQALNADLPYDTFVKWQLAGDEYEPENNLALMATGFLAAGAHSTQITKKEVEKHRYDELDDIVATTGTAMLGLTVGCARCHDHKYDPLPMGDYYRLVSAFTTTVRTEVDLHLDEPAFRKAKAAFDLEHAPYQAALRDFEAEQLPARLMEWEMSGASQTGRFPWTVLDVVSSRAVEGTTFTRLEDGSLLAGGKNPKVDTWTFTVHTDLTNITAIRLEALTDRSLARGGPGRADNGNFALSDFKVTAAPRTGAETKPTAVVLRNPRATFEQKGLPVKAAIDSDGKSAWAIDPQFGKDHAAVFETSPPIGFPGGTVLTITLQFRNNDRHAIGRPRLSVMTAAGPVELTAPGLPQPIAPLLRIPAERRSTEQTTALLRWYRTLDPEWRKLNQAALDHLARAPKPSVTKALVSSEGLPAVRLHTQGEDFLKETHYLKRGDPEQKEGVAELGFLQVLMSAPEKGRHWPAQPPPGSRTSFRRKAVAEWITDVEHGAGRLLARVIVNRLWQYHMGRGLVATASDFGTRGDPPTHPELLDWLATELIHNGWRLKPIHKLIMSSAVYRQESRLDEARARLDRENRLWWRRPSRRLEAEIIRDALLAVSGTLDTRMFGPGTLDESSIRRSIYFTVKRSKSVPMMQVFDAPEALVSIGERPTTTIAPQALVLMNNPNVRQWARNLARRIAPDPMGSVADAVRAGYQAALSRPPTAAELTDSSAFVQQQLASHQAAGKANSRELALADFCQVLMCLNEFIYIE